MTASLGGSCWGCCWSFFSESCVSFLVTKSHLPRAPTLTYGHELWVVARRMRSQIQAANMSFLRSVEIRVRSSGFQRELGVELILHVGKE